MSFGVSGLMSGLDTESIITQMMEIEERPVLLLQQQEAAYQAQISGIGTLKGILGELQTAADALTSTSAFSGFSASSSDESVLAVTASDDAVAGTYRVTVDALAQAQHVKSSSFDASDEAVGTGTLTIQVGTNDAVDVVIDATNNSLADIATAINDSEADVSAGVIYDGTDYYLTLTSKETGTANTISFSIDDGDDVDDDAAGLSALYATPGDQTMSQTQPAANAELNVNGIDVERAGNTIDDLLEGLTLTLGEDDPGNPQEITVSRDVSTVLDKMNTFVTKYNNAQETLNVLQASDRDSGQIGLLQGDSMVRMLQSRLQSMLYTQVDGVDSAVNSFSELGMTVDREGVLSLDSTVFTEAYGSKREDVVNFLSQNTEGSEGVARQFDNLLEGYLKFTGLLNSKTSSLNASVGNIEGQVERIEMRLDAREATLRRQFESLESLLAEFQNTSGILNQQLDALSNLNSQISLN